MELDSGRLRYRTPLWSRNGHLDVQCILYSLDIRNRMFPILFTVRVSGWKFFRCMLRLCQWNHFSLSTFFSCVVFFALSFEFSSSCSSLYHWTFLRHCRRSIIWIFFDIFFVLWFDFFFQHHHHHLINHSFSLILILCIVRFSFPSSLSY